MITYFADASVCHQQDHAVPIQLWRGDNSGYPRNFEHPVAFSDTKTSRNERFSQLAPNQVLFEDIHPPESNELLRLGGFSLSLPLSPGADPKITTASGRRLYPQLGKRFFLITVPDLHFLTAPHLQFPWHLTYIQSLPTYLLTVP